MGRRGREYSQDANMAFSSSSACLVSSVSSFSSPTVMGTLHFALPTISLMNRCRSSHGEFQVSGAVIW